jgi:diguanylate cyclase
MGMTCDRLENLTECFAEIKIQDDSTGLCTRDNFLKILATEIERSRHVGTNLSLCFMKLVFEDPETGEDNPAKEPMICALGDCFSREIRNWDTLSRYGLETFVLLMPQTALDEAQQFCNRLKNISENSCVPTDNIPVKLTLGLAEFSPEQPETGPELLARATDILQNEV